MKQTLKLPVIGAVLIGLAALLSDVAHPQTAFAAVFAENFDGVTPPALPADWTATTATDCADSNPWATSTSGTPAPPSDTPPNAAFVNDPSCISDERLRSPAINVISPAATLTFRNNWNLENGFDGGVLEIAIPCSGTFQDILLAGGSFATGGYNGVLSTCCDNPLPGRAAWTGTSGGFITTTVNLPASASGQAVCFSWRRGTDSSNSGQGWRIDSITSTGTAADHFKCYKANGPSVKRTVRLADQFGEQPRVKVDETRLFCNPVDKNGEGIADPTAHLTCYLIGAGDNDPERDVVVLNQFGEQTLKVENPEVLCVPSEKNGEPSALDLDHFKCYAAQGDPVNVTVDLEDQFGADPQVLVGKPEVFCNPVSKNDEGINNPNGHLTCYEIEAGNNATGSVRVRNQFGARTLKLKQPELLCVPSEKLSVDGAEEN